MTAISKEKDGSNKIVSLTPQTKEILHQSILHYLHRSGFSKTLKRFLSEAQIQNDLWKASSANLEDIYCKYIDACRHTEDEKNTTSKKKKSNVESNKDATEDQSKTTMIYGEIKEDNSVAEPETKAQKKKSKDDIKSDEPKKPVDDDSMNESRVNESKKKPKDKKRKNNQQDQKEVCTKVKPEINDTENGDVDPDVVKEETKSSKKRKRLSSDENEHQSVNTTEANKEDDVNERDSHGNEKPEINGENGSQKSMKKQRIGSAEPKTINAFQRVKLDQVEFAHEKLQDNSYWAKDGADVGYGAKAQEVLGQVRGRDFRHEKTKKKRGSYRGGQIDLQSHSIKFNYSDEE